VPCGRIIRLVPGDEWRVEVQLDDEQQGQPFAERLRSLDLDDELRERLGGHAIVTRDGPHLFVYAQTESHAREAERVIRELLAQDALTANVAETRWHPDEEAWKDAAVPLPQTEAEREAERTRLEAAEEREAAVEGSYDWHVKVELPGRREAIETERLLSGEGVPVRRRWRYLTIGTTTEEAANELGARLREELPAGSEVWVQVNPEDLPRRLFFLIPPL
jgi:hypothetical protein